MRKLTLSIFALILSSTSSHVVADAISKNVILEKVMDGSVRWESRLIYFALESAEKSTLDSWASRQKIVYPKFESDLLYYRITYDEQYEYRFYYNYVHSQCLYETQKREDAKITRLCWEDIGKCRQKESFMDGQDVIYSCHKKSTNCSHLGSNKSSAEVVDKKYCEKIYGRSL